MSKFNRFATKFDIIARGVISDFEKAERREREAQDKLKQYPQRAGIVSPEYQAEQAKANAEYLDAKLAMNKLKQDRPAQAMKAIKELRGELEKALFDTFAPRASAVDMQCVELLNSGVLTDNEYLYLVQDALNNGNYTMARMIGHKAEQLANDRPHEEAITLRHAAQIGKQDHSAPYLETFDNLTDIFTRCVNNPGIMDRWGEFTRDTMEAF